MKNRVLTKYIIVLWCLVPIIQSCSKYLEEKPKKSLSTFSKVEDLQAILDNDLVSGMAVSALQIVGADEFYMTTSSFDAQPPDIQSAYLWDSKSNIDGWSASYSCIYLANTVLYELKRVSGGDQKQRNFIESQALFLRSLCFFNLATLYCKAYSSQDLNTLGLPLRTVPDIDVKFARSTLKQTFDRIIEDLTISLTKVPDDEHSKNRASKAAIYGFLARVYLYMGDYTNSILNAQKYLDINSELVDYNSLNLNRSATFTHLNNKEVIYYSYMNTIISSTRMYVDTTLYESYDNDDLRKKALYKKNATQNMIFKGSYAGLRGDLGFSGVATDEVLLIRAECFARKGDLSSALLDINKLLKNRYSTGTFTDYISNNPKEVLEKVLSERRKELVFRGLRWMDIKRLNVLNYNISQKRMINNNSFMLKANDNRYEWLIPIEVIQLSNIDQNPR